MNDAVPFIIISLLLVEVIFQLTWFKLYFRNGIPVYKKKYPFWGVLSEPFDTKYLEQQFKSSYSCTIFFKRFNEFECGFREKLWELRLLNYIPVMRGMIKGDEKNKSFYIVGYLNWYVFLFVAYVLITSARGIGAIGTPVLVLVVILYAVQFYRFDNIAKVAFEWLKNNK